MNSADERRLKILNAVSSNTRKKDIDRLDTGELSSIGDSIIEGKENCYVDGYLVPISTVNFGGLVEQYKPFIKKIEVDGIELEPPLTCIKKVDRTYWVISLIHWGLVIPSKIQLDGGFLCWGPTSLVSHSVEQALKSGLIFDNKEAAQQWAEHVILKTHNDTMLKLREP